MICEVLGTSIYFFDIPYVTLATLTNHTVLMSPQHTHIHTSAILSLTPVTPTHMNVIHHSMYDAHHINQSIVISIKLNSIKTGSNV